MDIHETLPPLPKTNRHSAISLTLGILTLLTLCGGIIPIPFTGFICFPISFLLGLLALIYGGISLNRIRKTGESGRFMAWSGIILGGFVFFCMVCVLVALLSLFLFAPGVIPPFLENHPI